MSIPQIRRTEQSSSRRRLFGSAFKLHVCFTVLLCARCTAHEASSPVRTPDQSQKADRTSDHGPLPFKIETGEFAVVDEGPGMLRYALPGSKCSVDIHWWRPFPEHTGGAMMVASRRQVDFGGEPRSVLVTSMFEGIEREVSVTTLSGKGWFARVVFDGCAPHEEDSLLHGISLPAPPR